MTVKKYSWSLCVGENETTINDKPTGNSRVKVKSYCDIQLQEANKTDVIYDFLFTGSIKVLQGRSLDYNVLLADDKNLKKHGIMGNKSLSNTGRFAPVDCTLVEYY